MSVARAYSGIESFMGAGNRDTRRRDRFVERITGRAGKAIDDGQTSYEVRGARFGLSLTTHDADVYVGVAEELRDRQDPAEIEVYRMRGYRSMPNPDGSMSMPGSEMPYEYDVLTVQSVGGVAMREGGPPQGDEVLSRVYPPEE